MFDESVTSVGEQTTTGKWEDDSCKMALKLIGPETGLTATSIQVSGCSDGDQLTHLTAFSGPLMGNNIGETQWARSLIHASVGLYYVISGEIETTGEQEIGNMVFEARRSGGGAHLGSYRSPQVSDRLPADLIDGQAKDLITTQRP